MQAILNNTPGARPTSMYYSTQGDIDTAHAAAIARGDQERAGLLAQMPPDPPPEGMFFSVADAEFSPQLRINAAGNGLESPSQATLDAEALARAKTEKLYDIGHWFGHGQLRAVDENGYDWKGGESSASAISGAVRASEASGAQQVPLWPHHAFDPIYLNIAQGKEVALKIAMQYAQDFALCKQLEKSVEAAADAAALDLIVIPAQWS